MHPMHVGGPLAAILCSAAAADVTIGITDFRMAAMHFWQAVAPCGLVGSLTAVSIDATISGSVSKTYAQDLAVYLDALPLDSAGLVQVGGFTRVNDAAAHLMWPSGDHDAAGTRVTGTVTLPQPMSMAGSPLAVFLGNGYGTPWALATWNGTITLHGVRIASDGDTDGDGIANSNDNCPNVANPGQSDCDGDGFGDACDPDGDCDGDGIADTCQLTSKSDTNRDGWLDRCQYAIGDLNLSGVVDTVDLALLLALWGQQNPGIPDPSGDGTFGSEDLALLLARWGSGL